MSNMPNPRDYASQEGHDEWKFDEAQLERYVEAAIEMRRAAGGGTPEAWLFTARKPGRWMQVADLDDSGWCCVPFEEWKKVERQALVLAGVRETIWPRPE